MEIEVIVKTDLYVMHKRNGNLGNCENIFMSCIKGMKIWVIVKTDLYVIYKRNGNLGNCENRYLCIKRGSISRIVSLIPYEKG